ncbi:MAG: histidine kinase [Verrucomicrobia bacterium]|jgi:signal transduction histidine kinase|nr:histidine kinase [Verrucomicrobiota bacterium]
MKQTLIMQRLRKTLRERTAKLAAVKRLLRKGIRLRKGVENTLKANNEHYARLLKESLQLQEGLRKLTHQVLRMQEEDRKHLSHELQDEIAQALLGINVRLLSLKEDARGNNTGLKHEITSTQRLVARSVRSVRRVARKFGSL